MAPTSSKKRKTAVSGNTTDSKRKVVGKPLREAKIGEGDVIQPGCDVLIKAMPKGTHDFVARVLRIVQTKNKSVEVLVRWYYRPEDTVGGVKEFHGEKELFSSDHEDFIDLDSINGICTVHSLPEYQKLDVVKEEDFYKRYSYKPSVQLFKPDIVVVYCVCEQPYNPDKVMVMCEKCTEWYHPQCLGYKDEHAPQLKRFRCHLNSRCLPDEPTSPEKPVQTDKKNRKK